MIWLYIVFGVLLGSVITFIYCNGNDDGYWQMYYECEMQRIVAEEYYRKYSDLRNLLSNLTYDDVDLLISDKFNNIIIKKEDDDDLVNNILDETIIY